jgi:PHD/YefM family antitoxin component YafN of YafNO toxin-antitoxin module
MKIINVADDPQTLALLDAADRQPVLLRRNNRDAAVLLSPSEYQRLLYPEVTEFDAACELLSAKVLARGFTEEKLQAILTEIHDEGRL